MEYDWERKFPFLKIDKNVVEDLFEGILDKQGVTDVIPIDEGCRTTNYIIETNGIPQRYILKIFMSKEQNYKKEIRLLTRLKEDGILPVPKIYRVSEHESIQGREYGIYEYKEGKTIGQAISEGYKVSEEFVRDVAKYLAMIHNYKFIKAGFLDEDLNLEIEVPGLVSWYEMFMGTNAKNRLGKDVVNKINKIVQENEKILLELDKDIRLVHGDFQGTNILVKDNKLSGILDWEFSMAGHPIADIGQFFRYEEYFDNNLIKAFEEEYNKNSDYKLIEDWYKISKLRDLTNLIQLINGNEDMPNKYANIKAVVVNILKQF
ncbi:aminoglycoside phosphotransferase family protein [Clostridium sp. C2-6-12]|uniref:phosphotransferase family protein n=1 Tax=Clostridium sp. C2-6-12 TaxID=2698832 RepID=UPI001367CD88|nr:aminoglycoside phosphotransferase family protein [Clostridium sp. C2-6-12]